MNILCYKLNAKTFANDLILEKGSVNVMLAVKKTGFPNLNAISHHFYLSCPYLMYKLILMLTLMIDI